LNVRIIRAFISIDLPEDIKTNLTRLQNILKAGNYSWLRWVKPEGIHLTLKFLGDVSSDKIDEITMAINDAVRGTGPFSLHIEGTGVFPNLKRIQVVWVGLDGDLDILRNLQQRVEDNMEILGYPAEGREFTPHLTLARVRLQPPPHELEKFTQVLTTTKPFEGRILVKNVNFMESQLTPRGAIYNKLGSVMLNPP
jgi:2'-5' RNA ligase